jgi:hypothetical protein
LFQATPPPNADADPSLNARRPTNAALDHLQQSHLGEAEHAGTCQYQVLGGERSVNTIPWGLAKL